MYKGRDILSKYSTHCGRQSCFPFYNLATFDKKNQTNPQKNKIYRVGNSNICVRHGVALQIQSNLPMWSSLLSSHLYSKVTILCPVI